uniref:Uncharacterized protein n=1 Tax=Caenorhabditis tropicalis TaxID=1561998 RepID=A0A1I7UPM4_9PELO
MKELDQETVDMIMREAFGIFTTASSQLPYHNMSGKEDPVYKFKIIHWIPFIAILLSIYVIFFILLVLFWKP